MASGVLGWYITGASLTSVGVPELDQLLTVVAISVIFTAFALGGVANAVNLIDGYNGMASGFVMLALLALASVAADVGDLALAKMALHVAAAFFGLFLVNWPFGKLFLGDSGAYLGGFLVGWICVLLTERNESVSPFAALLVCVHPVTETAYTLLRRLRSGANPGEADIMHLHNMIYFGLMQLANGRMKVVNPLSGLVVTSLSIPPALLAYRNYNSGTTCASLVLIYVVFYLTIYLMISKRLKKQQTIYIRKVNN
jgi:UDP-N-acetylmuramyl pentapeptide phosphotransferase/UDP-N-acetylglucosamine-1-phosphate transferase